MDKTQLDKTLGIIAKAWGRTQSGYCFFPWIDREQQRKTGLRKAGFHEGPAFVWPKDRAKIVDHMAEHQDHDLYWCPNLFEYKERRENVAMDECALYADLDEVDPRTLTEYPPTTAWETSPGRYQCLWVASAGDFQGASWAGNENQRMTYLIGADASGWDTTQLLRIPGWNNHKPEYSNGDKPPAGKLLWANKQTYLISDFKELPEVKGFNASEINDALETEVEKVDRLKVIARIRLKLNKRARELLSAKNVEIAKGEQGDNLWYLIRCIADVGCSVAEIVAVVRDTPWNKFRDRADEMHRLIIEASKAIANRSEETEAKLEADGIEEVHDATPQRFGAMLKNVKRPQFIVENILTVGACGFIAGEPKCFKSWTALDLGISVSTGTDFLGYFRVNEPGPVLYIQEEDPLPTLKTRTAKIWAGKAADKLVLIDDGNGLGVEWLPPDSSQEFDPDINAVVQEGITISDEAWQLWLDETLAKGMQRRGEDTPTPYKLMILDTLMMMAGDVEESKAQEMTTKIFRPLKVLARKHNVAIMVVHHMGKSERLRPGQRMLGSVANHAWSEDAIYLTRPATGKYLRIDTESKSAPGGIYKLQDDTRERGWEPIVSSFHEQEETVREALETLDPAPASKPRGHLPRESQDRLKTMLIAAGERGITTAEIADKYKITKSTAWRRLRRLEDMNQVEKFQRGKFDAWRAI